MHFVIYIPDGSRQMYYWYFDNLYKNVRNGKSKSMSETKLIER